MRAEALRRQRRSGDHPPTAHSGEPGGAASERCLAIRRRRRSRPRRRARVAGHRQLGAPGAASSGSGSGTFGEVYRAWDRHLEREVALKLLRPASRSTSDDDPHSSRIAREGRLLARVRHPNVITVYGVEVHDGRVGLWMELIRGTTLEALLQKRGPFSAQEAALIGIDLCRALAAIHAAGLIHRDVKAQNVMREDGGRIVLMDLGTGRELDQEQGDGLPDLAGTPLYLAPEIFDGAAASEQTDLYSLGVLLYHLVTGSFPVQGDDHRRVARGHRRSAPVSGCAMRVADLPTAFVRVVDRAIAADPSRRYASAGALEADLAQTLEVTAVPAAADAPVDVPKDVRPSAWRRAGAAAALAASLVVALLAWRGLAGVPLGSWRRPRSIRSPCCR